MKSTILKLRTMKPKGLFLAAILMTAISISMPAQQFQLNSAGYFNNQGVDVMAFNDF